MQNDLRENEAKWVEIDLDAVEYNMRQIREKVGKERRIAAVIKANGYGHGALEIADALLSAGADQFAVSFLAEALELRKKYGDKDILVLGSMPDSVAADAVKADIQQTVTSYDRAKVISDATVKLNRHARIHIKLDTGMTRIGFQMTPDSIDEIVKISKLPGLELEGIFTHYATADERDKTYAKKQFERYMNFVDKLEEKGISFKIRHTSNSAAIMEMPDTYLDMVRPGIILYGVYPSDEVERKELDIKPVMSFKARISFVKELSEERGISYGQRFTAPKGTALATVPVGYADGYTRCLSGKVEILYKGTRLPVRGNICMDQCMVDVTPSGGANVGDVVTLIGSEGDNTITVDDLANQYGTIGYEVLCGINRRVPRIYMRDGKPVKKVNYLLGIEELADITL